MGGMGGGPGYCPPRNVLYRGSAKGDSPFGLRDAQVRVGRYRKGNAMKQRYAVMAFLCGSLAWLGSAHAQKETNWPSFGNDPGAMRYSALTQINTENVNQLKLAWKFDTSSVQGLWWQN